MWLFTNTGFVSAVSTGTELMVRSRDRESLESLAEAAKSEIISTPSNDYPYRTIVSHEIFSVGLHTWQAISPIRTSNQRLQLPVDMTLPIH